MWPDFYIHMQWQCSGLWQPRAILQRTTDLQLIIFGGSGESGTTGIKNGHLIEIYRHVKSCEIPWAEVQQALLVGSPQDWTNIPHWMVPAAFTAVYRKHQQLSKTTNGNSLERYHNWLAQAATLYRPPRKRKSQTAAEEKPQAEHKRP